MTDHTTRLLEAKPIKGKMTTTKKILEALKESHVWHWTIPSGCPVCQLIAEVEAELKGGYDE